jgi:two-component system, NtrC family, response regulator HydG
MNTILVVDDKEMMRDSVGSTLQRAGFQVLCAEDGQAALTQIAARRPDAVITDLKMPGLSGLELIERIRQIDDELPVVMMTAFANVETAVKAMKLGAFDYITKPFEGDELVIAVKRAIAHARVLRENAILRASRDGVCSGDGGNAGPRGEEGRNSAAPGPLGLNRIIGDSPAIRRVKEQVLAVAESQGTVMVCGESGSGKEVIARAIHELSPRAGAPLLAVNCAALSESLLESELFGHERGAFTGAERLRKGRFELADGGTLLLDEVSEIGQHIQAKLLRVLQERTFERVGSSLAIGIDVRIVATSNRDLPQSVGRGDFRQDLFFRLNVLPIHLPPLRDRLEDVPALAEHFVRYFCQREGRGMVQFDEWGMALLQQYHWPGNVRELQNICERAVVLTTTRSRSAPEPVAIGRELLEPWLSAGAAMTMGAAVGHLNGFMEAKPSSGLPQVGAPLIDGPVRTLEELEREAIILTLKRFNGHRQKTATALGIGVRTLGLKLRKWKDEKLIAESV